MIKRLSIVVLTSFLWLNGLISQDLHFTNYDSSPQNLNPALNGNFRGTLKFGGIYRDQFSQFFGNGYRSYGGFVNHNLSMNVRDGDWVAIGGFIDADQSGDLSFGTSRAGLNLSYNLAGDFNVFSLGVQGVMLNRRLSAAPAVTGNFIRSGTHGEDLTNLAQNYQSSQFDLGLGINHKMYINDKTISNVGISVYHLLASSRNLANQSLDYFPLRINAHAEMTFIINEGAGLRPRIFYTKSEAASELVFQVINGFNIGSQNLDVGIGYRVQDAIQFLIGIPFKGWNINGAFDMTTSSARAYNNSFGAFELGIHKIITIHPKTEIKQVKVCPRF